jgi:site-specific DNA-methyltransferase (adenine-specific)
MSIVHIALTEIVVSEDRQRKTFDEAELESLRESITDPRHGLYNPLLVRPRNDGKFTLVAGERRFRAISGITEPYKFGEATVQPGFVPALASHFQNDFDAMEAELFENVLRVNLTWQEQAAAISALHKIRTEKNPKHSAGMTAALISGTGKDYAPGTAYEKVNNAIFVSGFLDNPEVRKATTLKEGTKIASRIMEEEHLNRLKQIRDARVMEAAKEASMEKVEVDEQTPPKFDFLPPTSPKAPDGVFYAGDFRTHLDKIPDGTVQVVLTDPPYGMGVADFADGGRGTLKHEYSEEGFEDLYRALIESLDDKCTANAHVYIFCDIDFFHEAKQMFSEQWTVRRAPLIWSRGQMGKLADGGPTGYTRTYELILHARRGKRSLPEVCPDVIVVTEGMKEKIHAAQKPVPLYSKLIALSALPGELVWDPFAGSGTIFHAAKETMTKAIGMELNPKFATNIEMFLTGEPPF